VKHAEIERCYSQPYQTMLTLLSNEVPALENRSHLRYCIFHEEILPTDTLSLSPPTLADGVRLLFMGVHLLRASKH